MSKAGPMVRSGLCHQMRRTCWHRGAGARREGSEAAEGDEQSGSAACRPSRATSQRAGPRPGRAQGRPRAERRDHAPCAPDV